jgi:hypothetical protein
MVGIGIDLAGYMTGKTALAFVKIENQSVKAMLLRGSALSKRRKSNDPLDEIVAEEVKVIERCLAIGPVAVDVPIDLQGLPNPPDPKTIWALTRRPIDYAINAMPPLADRIGAPVARFAAIMRKGNFEDRLGVDLFEAYPAITLKLLKIPAAYKGKKGAKGLASLCEALKLKPRFESDDDLESDDDVDAIICAITAASPLSDLHEANIFEAAGPLPKGFRIPKNLTFNKIEFSIADFADWAQAYEAAA